jgi:hypothetical protein
MSLHLAALATGPRWLFVLAGPGTVAAPAAVFAQIAGPAAAGTHLLGRGLLGFAAAVPAQSGVGRADWMAAFFADAGARDAPAGVLLQNAVLAARRTCRLGRLFLDPAPTPATVQVVEVSDGSPAGDAVSLPLAHCSLRWS